MLPGQLIHHFALDAVQPASRVHVYGLAGFLQQRGVKTRSQDRAGILSNQERNMPLPGPAGP
jgi:hypothetical protein